MYYETKETKETLRKFEMICSMMGMLKKSDDNETKKEFVKMARDKGYITNEEAIDLYVEYETLA